MSYSDSLEEVVKLAGHVVPPPGSPVVVRQHDVFSGCTEVMHILTGCNRFLLHYFSSSRFSVDIKVKLSVTCDSLLFPDL